MKKIVLPPEVLDDLNGKAYPSSGGFQNFIRKLQRQTDQVARTLEIDEADEASIRQKAANGDGGWQKFFQKLTALIDQ